MSKRIVDINTYWPTIVRDTEQFGQIAVAENEEFNRLSECIFRALEDSFIESATEYGVKRWESMLQIAPSASDTLDDRKARILTYLNLKLPYTWRVLKQLIAGVVGEDNFEMSLDNDTQTLSIKCYDEHYDSISTLVSRVIPMNLNVEYVFYELPFGYLRAEFWENTISNWSNASYIETEWLPENGQNVVLEGDVQVLTHGGSFFVSVVARNRIWPNAIGFYHQDGNFITVRGYNNGRHLDRWLMNCLNKRVKIKLVQQKLYIDGESLNYSNYGGYNPQNWTFEPAPAVIGRQIENINPSKHQDSSRQMRHYEWYLYDNTAPVRHYIPVLSVAGVPCMYDTVNKQTAEIQNLSACVLGFTLEQARKLGKLPDSGGAMKISLPTGYDTDAEATNALDVARSKGWTLTIQTYTPEPNIMTLDLYDVWVRKIQDENGTYVDAEGTRWLVEWCNCMYTPDGSTERDHGYESFESVDEACNIWGLTTWVDPNAEDLIEEGIENE